MIINTTQFLYVLTVLFVALKACSSYEEMEKVKDDQTKIIVHSIMLAFGIIIALLAWFWIIPSILTSFTITTNIEMMKNKECLHKVI